MSDQWVRRWEVRSFTEPEKKYTVALKQDGSFGCSCPAWKFKKTHPDCKHIEEIKSLLPPFGVRAFPEPPRRLSLPEHFAAWGLRPIPRLDLTLNELHPAVRRLADEIIKERAELEKPVKPRGRFSILEL